MKSLKERIEELRNKNDLYERVIDEILEDSEEYDEDIKERIIKRCSEIVEHGCSSGIVGSLIYYIDTSEFYDNFEEEIVELILELDEQGLEPFERLKRNIDVLSILLHDELYKNYVSWLVYEEIANKLLYVCEE